jgi:hypothetical protein
LNNREKYLKKAKDWMKENRLRGNKWRAIYRQKYPEKNSAHSKVGYALKTGVLIRPDHCSKCGLICKPEAHHPDYKKPLEVVWVCKPCHQIITWT